MSILNWLNSGTAAAEQLQKNKIQQQIDEKITAEADFWSKRLDKAHIRHSEQVSELRAEKTALTNELEMYKIFLGKLNIKI